jgi:hypothetical protein
MMGEPIRRGPRHRVDDNVRIVDRLDRTRGDGQCTDEGNTVGSIGSVDRAGLAVHCESVSSHNLHDGRERLLHGGANRGRIRPGRAHHLNGERGRDFDFGEFQVCFNRYSGLLVQNSVAHPDRDGTQADPAARQSETCSDASVAVASISSEYVAERRRKRRARARLATPVVGSRRITTTGQSQGEALLSIEAFVTYLPPVGRVIVALLRRFRFNHLRFGEVV